MIISETLTKEYVLRIKINWDLDGVGTPIGERVYETTFSTQSSAYLVALEFERFISEAPDNFALRILDYFDSKEISLIYGKNSYWPIHSLRFIPKIFVRTTETRILEDAVCLDLD